MVKSSLRQKKRLRRHISDAVWCEIKISRETTGATFRELEEHYGISYASIAKRAKEEGWRGCVDINRRISKKVEEKLIGIDSDEKAENEEIVLDAIDIEAGRKAYIKRNHRREWKVVDKLRTESLRLRKNDIKEAMVRARYARLVAEALSIQQKGEVLAWDFDAVSVDVTKLSDAQLKDLIAGKLPV